MVTVSAMIRHFRDFGFKMGTAYGLLGVGYQRFGDYNNMFVGGELELLVLDNLLGASQIIVV
jgi:hypothetical protein